MIETAQVEEKLVAFMDTCRARGIKATHQRSEIYRELIGTADHPNAETIYQSVRKRIPAISLDTVYRNLRLLEEKRIIGRVGSILGSARFDANVARHHHFICTRCGLIRDFYRSGPRGFERPPVDEAAYVDSVHVELRGVCKPCQAKRRKPG